MCVWVCVCVCVCVCVSPQIVNCKGLQVQVKGSVPSVAIDKTDGCQVYLSYASTGAQIVTSKSSELNVSFPQSEDPEAEWVRRHPPARTHTLTHACPCDPMLWCVCVCVCVYACTDGAAHPGAVRHDAGGGQAEDHHL